MKRIPLRAARIAAGYTLEEAAKFMKTSRQTVSKIENGIREATPAEALFLCNLYGFSIDDILFLPTKQQ